MPDILTITLNPAVDLSTATDAVVPGPKLRCDTPLAEPGGGGVNVSRAIRNLGGASRALVALSGAMGARMAQLLTAEGLDFRGLPAPGETRHSFAVTDSTTGAQYRFVLSGPRWAPTDIATTLAVILGACPRDGYAVLSGSNPPGVPPEFACQLSAAFAATGTLLVLDTSGEALEQIRRNPGPGPEVLRMNDIEAATLARRALPDVSDTAAFAVDLIAEGAARHVVIARGAQGSVMAGPFGVWHAAAAEVPLRSKIGAGDSFVAGMVLALTRGLPAPQALQYGAAAASAAVMTDGSALCRAEDFKALLPRCSLTPL